MFQSETEIRLFVHTGIIGIMYNIYHNNQKSWHLPKQSSTSVVFSIG